MVVNSKGIPENFRGIDRLVKYFSSWSEYIYIYIITNMCLTIGLVYIYIYIYVCVLLFGHISRGILGNVNNRTWDPEIHGLLRGAGSKWMGFPKVPLEDGG